MQRPHPNSQTFGRAIQRRQLAGWLENDVAVHIEGAENLSGLLVFVEEASGAIAAPHAERLEVDHVVGPWFQRRGLSQCAVRTVRVASGGADSRSACGR
jgi:hypothetical protein